MDVVEKIVLGLGCFALALLAPKIIGYILSLFARLFRRNPLNKRPEENDFAIVTGASDGIGLEYARQLARKGYNLLLMSRTLSKLDSVRDELLEKYPERTIKILAVNFSQVHVYESVEEFIKGVDGRIAILVNNVGMMNHVPELFTDPVNDFNMKMLICNTVAMTKLSEIVLPIMVKQKFGIVINLASVFGIIPSPYSALYSATKVYSSVLTGLLSAEYSQFGIIFQDVTPNQVKTNLTSDLQEAYALVSAESFVRYALNAVGKELHTSAHPRHKIVNNISRFTKFWIPERMFLRMIGGMWKNAAKKSSDSNPTSADINGNNNNNTNTKDNKIHP